MIIMHVPLHKFVLYRKNNESLKYLLKFGGLPINIAIVHVRLLLGHENIGINVFNVNNSECGGLTSLYICFQNRFSFENGINASLKSMLSKSTLDEVKLLLNAPNVTVDATALYKQNTVLRFGICLCTARDYGIDDRFFNVQKEN